MCSLSNDIYDYHFVSQGKTTIPGVDDAEEMFICDVSPFHLKHETKLLFDYFFDPMCISQRSNPFLIFFAREDSQKMAGLLLS